MNDTPREDPLDPFEPSCGIPIVDPPDQSIEWDDSWGTRHLFHQLLSDATLLAWSFDEQIEGAPPKLLGEWRSQLWELEECLAEVKHLLAAGEEEA
jgi:hypothetical protein